MFINHKGIDTFAGAAIGSPCLRSGEGCCSRSRAITSLRFLESVPRNSMCAASIFLFRAAGRALGITSGAMIERSAWDC
jgi:hypothetical protein